MNNKTTTADGNAHTEQHQKANQDTPRTLLHTKPNTCCIMSIENIYDNIRNTKKAAIQNDEEANNAFHHLRDSLSFSDRALLRDLLDYVRYVGPKAERFETKIDFRPKMPWPEEYTVKRYAGFALVVVDNILGEAVGWCTYVGTNHFVSWTTIETDVIRSKTIEQAEAAMFKQLCPNQD